MQLTISQQNLPHAPGTIPNYLKKMKKKQKNEDCRSPSRNLEQKPPALHRACTSTSISKFQSLVSSDLPKTKFLKKDPENEIFQKFSIAKKKFELGKSKLTVLQHSVLKSFKECQNFAKKAPNKITFDESLDLDTIKVVQPNDGFQDIKESLEKIESFLEDLKKQAQESGDQNLEHLGIESKSFENFEKRLVEFIEQFVS